ncbi:hypothetical protein HKW98_16050 [Stutzerimonas urumqiensis]|uniref:hypothetical protein n=1 Tax=Stutzerimonas urumqiensis TaxID=638269 RepID=UPI003BA9C67B
MRRERQAEDGGLYGRVLQRLGAALAQAERDTSGTTLPNDLVVSGLSDAELALIRAYLAKDDRWLSGWQAAAEEQAMIARQTARTPARRLLPRARAAQWNRSLSCALCGAEVEWPSASGPVVCCMCGSHLLLGRQRREIRRH